MEHSAIHWIIFLGGIAVGAFITGIAFLIGAKEK